VPTRKQRRRRQKDRRHDYEYVYVDESGNEVEVAEDEVAAQRTASRNGRAQPRQATRNPRLQPPSWRRVLKRGALFAPLMFVTVLVLNREASTLATILVTAQLMLIFVPFSYFMDSMMWRRYQKRIGAAPAKR